MSDEWRRVPGGGVYARPERERRFLVRWHPESTQPRRAIDDRYLIGTRLRLRKVTVGAESVFKLTQKVRLRADDPAEVALTSIYLDEDEFERLVDLPSALLSKTRQVVIVDGTSFAVDEFHGNLTGLVLAEIELPELSASIPKPAWLGTEVTHDDRYSGGSLAALGRDDALALITSTT